MKNNQKKSKLAREKPEKTFTINLTAPLKKFESGIGIKIVDGRLILRPLKPSELAAFKF